MASTSTHLAYTGRRVLDLSQGIAGPYCGQILRQFGADVVKAEPLEGDWSRRIGLARGGMTAITMAFNRGKRSLACDARNPEGRALLALLAARTGIVIQSFRPGVAQRMGLGPAEVRAANPSVIYVSISGFGQSGPDAQRPGTDPIAPATSGIALTNPPPHPTPRPRGHRAGHLGEGRDQPRPRRHAGHCQALHRRRVMRPLRGQRRRRRAVRTRTLARRAGHAPGS